MTWLNVFLIILGFIFFLVYRLRRTPYGLLTFPSAIIKWKYGNVQFSSAKMVRKGIEISTQPMNRQFIPVEKVEDFVVPNNIHPIPVRLYHPKPEMVRPVILYIHGGGWVAGSIKTHDFLCRRLAKKTNFAVLSVEYRLSPEHVFPDALDDVFAVLKWLSLNGEEISCNSEAIVIGGDSAGGNLAAATALKTRDILPDLIKAQILIYPVINVASLDTKSYQDFAAGFRLSQNTMDFFRQAYADRSEWDNPLVSPLFAHDLSGLPPANIITAEFDPLRDEGEAYGEMLEKAGVHTQVTRYQGVLHGFFGHSIMGQAGLKAIDEVADFLQTIFEK